MSETRPTYQAGQQPAYKTVVSYHVTWPGDELVSIHNDHVLTCEARNAIDAAGQALEAIRQFTPPRGKVTNLILIVSLEF